MLSCLCVHFFLRSQTGDSFSLCVWILLNFAAAPVGLFGGCCCWSLASSASSWSIMEMRFLSSFPRSPAAVLSSLETSSVTSPLLSSGPEAPAEAEAEPGPSLSEAESVLLMAGCEPALPLAFSDCVSAARASEAELPESRESVKYRLPVELRLSAERKVKVA